jgi:Short C-terminal domain
MPYSSALVAYSRQSSQTAQMAQIRRACVPGSPWDGKLSDLHDRGVVSDAEFERGKEKILQ